MLATECEAKIQCLRADALYHEGLLAKSKGQYSKACGKFSAAMTMVRKVFWSGFPYNGKPVSEFSDKIRKALHRATQMRDEKRG